MTYEGAHAGFMRRLRAVRPAGGTEPTAVQLRGCRRACCPRGGHPVVAKQSFDAGCRDSQQWSPCSVVLAWAALRRSQARSRHPHQPAISSRRRLRTSRVQQPRTSHPFLAGTTGRSRRRARRSARVRGQSKPARRRPPRPPGRVPTTSLRGAAPRLWRAAPTRRRRRRRRRRRAPSSSPPRCGRRPTRAAEARQCDDGRRRQA